MSKIILVFVEGITDKISLELMINTLVPHDRSRPTFIVHNCDITQQLDVSVQNIVSKLGNAISEGIQQLERKYKIKPQDIERIIHVVDTDGVYISDAAVEYHSLDKIKYTLDKIYTQDVQFIKNRNEKKSSILDRLYPLPHIRYTTQDKTQIIPYNIYYMSCNLEHVLHNVQNPSEKEKTELAEDWQQNISKDIEKILDFWDPKNPYIVNQDYNASWKFIKQGNNSLKRYTNFHLFLQEIAKETET